MVAFGSLLAVAASGRGVARELGNLAKRALSEDSVPVGGSYGPLTIPSVKTDV